MADLPKEIRDLVPAGLRPELAHGLALWLAGASTLSAAKQSNCPQRTIWDAVQRLPEALKDARASYAETAEDLIFPVIQESAKQTLENLIDGKFKPMEVAAVMGRASANLASLRNVISGSSKPSDLADVIGKLAEHGGGQVTIGVETNRVLDTTARESEE